MATLLDSLNTPGDLRRLDADQLDRLAAQIRDRLVQSVTRTGGHLGPNLGVVELTIALHRVFDSPRDAIVWDTGHQAYVHKMLTGRQAGFGGLRQSGGLSGYPNRAESEHDLVENSHASTALSYADGLAKGFALTGGSGRRVVAVVGDGALTGGMCWEALNNIAAAPHRPVVIVLNDNGRSYAPTVGGVAAHLADVRRRDADRAELFERLGLAYLGPVDGHSVAAVEQALRDANGLGCPVVVHCVTRKGCGYPPAEGDEADCLHTVSAASSDGSAAEPWTDVFGQELLELAVERPDIVAVTAAMLRPTGLLRLAEAMPDRVFDVGIAEQHAVTSAAGLATAGLHPVVCIYSTFLNRAYDQVLMDVALHRLPVTFVLDRAGITGNDGPSHHGMWDLSILGTVPGLRLAAPRDGVRLRELLRSAVSTADGPTAVRFPKGSVGPPIPAVGQLGRADVLAAATGAEVLVLAVGPMAAPALEAAELLRADGVATTVVDPRWVHPVDPALVLAAAEHRLVVTVEDNGRAGGFGDGYARALRAAGRSSTPLVTLGLPQDFLSHGGRGDLLRAHGLHPTGIAAAVESGLAQCNNNVLRRRDATHMPSVPIVAR